VPLSTLTRLRQHRLVLRPTRHWERVKVGGGAPPVLTADGWLPFYHGVEDCSPDAQIEQLRYSVGVLIVDRYDVTRIVYQSEEPILIPETEHELAGMVNNVVFPTGIDMISDDTLYLYYGMADSCIGAARVWLNPAAALEDSLEAS
jgi:beta-1,2-mannobiose phosphorylase / 1,2-beta-oligomannan phosphorylase